MRFEVPCCRDFIFFLLFLILSVMTGPVAVDAQISERALTQAEIVTIRGQQYRKVGDMLFALSEKEPTRKSMKSRRWTNGLVPYEFNGNVENENRERFRNATAMWMDRVPALEFVECQQEPTEIEPCDSEGNHIHVLTADENSSPVGMIGGEQPLNMVSWSVQGVILHELGHAIGFNHEHNRGDRDSFVEILWENIEEKHFAFYKQKGVHYAGYDFESIMHYRQNAFGMNDPEGGLLPTILPLPGFTHYTESMGARNCGDGCLSVSDIAEASRRYLPIDKASDTCTFTVVQNDWIEAEPNSTSSGSTYRVQPGRTWISTPTAHLQIRPSETNFVTGGVVSVAFPSETPNRARLFHDENLANPVHLDGRQYRYASGEGPIDLWFWPDIEADAWTTVEVRHFDSDANTEALVFFTIHANCGGSGGGGNLAVAPAVSLDSIGEEGGPFQNRAQSYTLSNEAARSVPYIVNIDYHGTSADWLTVSSSEGEIEADSDQVVTISLSEATGSLAPGDYRATIRFETNGEQIVRSATLDVASTTGGSGPGGHTLTVVKQGQGDGTVSGGGIHCGPGCSSQSVQVPDGQSVTLTTTPDANSTFVGFSGFRCYGTGDCTFTMGTDVEQTVSFGLPESLRVLYTSPVDGDFSMSNDPMFYFNRPVNPGPYFHDATITGPDGTVSAVNPVIHESSSPSRHRLFLLSEISLERGETYAATIPAGAVVDDDGNPLPLAHSIQWTAPLADQPPMYVSVTPRYAVENERVKLSVWFEEPIDFDRPIYLDNPDGLLEHISEIHVPAGETLVEETIKVSLTPGSIENEQAELKISSPGYGQQSVVVSIGNLTSSYSSDGPHVVAAGVMSESNGDGIFEAGEEAELLFEVINFGSVGQYVVLHFSVINASPSDLRFLGGDGGQYCYVTYLGPGDYGNCSPGTLRADEELPSGDYYIRVEGTDQYGNPLFVNQESIRVVNNTLPDYTVDLAPITSSELDPGREIEVKVNTKNYSDGFDPAMVPFQVILEIEGEERVLYDTYTDVRGYITSLRTFRLPVVYPSVPGEHALWARINPPGPGQLAESDHSNNDSSIRIIRVKAPNVAPEIQPIGGPFSVASGEPFTLTVGATDDDGDTVTFSLGPTAPSGMVIDSASGLLSWNPQCGQEGTVSVEILATDDEGAFDSKSIVLDVVTLADLAVELTPSTLEAQVGTTVEWTLAITNQGPSCVVGARVSQTVPSGLSNSEWTCTASAGSFCLSAGSGHLDEAVDVMAFGTAVFTWTADTSDGATGTAALTGAVAIPGEGMDPDSNNDASTATVVFIEADCHPPASGDWIVTESCEFTHQAVAPADVIVEPGVVLTIAPGAILEIDLHNQKLLVKDTGGVLVQDGGTIRQTTGTLQP